jgi:single-stranded DNA-binding protein
MNSFKLTAVGNLARNPELSTDGRVTFARFCLVGKDRVSDGGRGPLHDVASSLWFLAFAEIATAIAQSTRKGDQLILEAQVIGTQWNDRQRERQLGTVFIVTGFKLGARRGEQDSPVDGPTNPPTRPNLDTTQATVEDVG